MKSEEELMAELAEPIVYADVYYGKCLITVWEAKFPRDAEGKICGRMIHWNEGDNPKDKILMFDMVLDLCPGCTSEYQVKISEPKYGKDLQKIVFPSLIEAGAVTADGKVSIAAVKDHWVKMQKVEGTRLRDKNDPDKGCWNTYKFLAIYQSEQECLEAMALDNGEAAPAPAAAPKAVNADKREQRRTAALQFVQVTAMTMKGQPAEEIRKQVTKFITENPNVNPYLTADDPEVVDLINEAANEPPF